MRGTAANGQTGAAGKGGEPGVSRRAPQCGRWIQLTGRGAVFVMFAVFSLGLLGASWLTWPVLAGGAFVIGSMAAAWYTRPGDLLTVAVTPPLLFCVILVGVKALTATGNAVIALAEGTAITLAGVAPWLFAGMALSLIIAWTRGLPECVRELRRDLQGNHARPGAGSRPGSGSTTPGVPPPRR